LMASALDVPAAPEQPSVPDDTLARTGNTADHQAGWFAGMEQGQANAQANMAIRPPSRDWKAIQVAIDDYLDGYELRADEGAHTPTDFERFLLDDCIAGLLAEDDILVLLAGAAAPTAGDTQDAARYRWLCDKFGITKLPCAIERIIQGSYVADGKAAIDAAIDTAIAAQQGKGGAA
ncbi:TPA: hypothetical protein ACKRM8_006068, partial [Pseudomonas aeruginosa]